MSDHDKAYLTTLEQADKQLALYLGPLTIVRLEIERLITERKLSIAKEKEDF